MKKQLAMVSLLSVAAVSMFATSADATVIKEAKTDVGIQFKSDEGTVGEDGPFKDNLALVFRPGSFKFGNQEAVVGNATFNSIKPEKKQYLVVNDDRTEATTPAWTLSANMSALVSGAGTEAVDLDGATLTYTLGDAKSYAIGEFSEEKNDYIPVNPSDDASVLGTLAAGNDIVLGNGTSKTVSLTAASASKTAILAKSKANAVKGGVATEITNVKLMVPDKGKKIAGKAFTGTVTWSLDDLAK